MVATAGVAAAAILGAGPAQATWSPDITVAASTPVVGAIATLTYDGTVTRAGTLRYVDLMLPKGTTGHATSVNGTLSTYAPGLVRWTARRLVSYSAGARLSIPVIGFRLPADAGGYSLGFRAVGGSYAAPMSAGYGSLTLRTAPVVRPPVVTPPVVTSPVVSRPVVTPRPAPAPAPVLTPPVVMPSLPAQAWPEPPVGCPTSYPTVGQENAKAGTADWTIPVATTALSMYATATSAACGDTVGLRIDSSSPVTVQAYRMGYYGGLGGRLVWTSAQLPATAQPNATFGGTGDVGSSAGLPLNMVDASSWTDSTSVPITSDFVPGTYLFKATDANGNSTYAPLTVRDDTHTRHAVLLQQATATWQAYNPWGGADFYTTPGSWRISYNRPYDRLGAGQFLDLERGLVFWAEQHNVDVTYWTDEDMHLYGSQIKARAATLWLPAHDEYYSYPMRQALTGAIASGVSVANFGANATYRETVYRDGMRSWDINHNVSTWRDRGPAYQEQGFMGAQYGCTPVGTSLTTNSTWLWAGITPGTVLAGFMNGENDFVQSWSYSPSGVSVMGYATGICNWQNGRVLPMDATTYTAASGARVFNGSSFVYGCFVVQQCPSNWGDGGATPTAAEAAAVSRAIGNVARWQGVPFTEPPAPTGIQVMSVPRVVNAAPMAIPVDTDNS
ncbi:MAG TPA: N,N-dimethylformamidase beta subunit family domain-containing protein [Pedococcus sp.]|nr:N,N-dimethylformamidase beta subunit family domain-containing protein [Pedococcus sp.]